MTKKVIISKKLIREVYCTNKSIKEISKDFNTSDVTIRRILKEYEIKTLPTLRYQKKHKIRKIVCRKRNPTYGITIPTYFVEKYNLKDKYFILDEVSNNLIIHIKE